MFQTILFFGILCSLLGVWHHFKMREINAYEAGYNDALKEGYKQGYQDAMLDFNIKE